MMRKIKAEFIHKSNSREYLRTLIEYPLYCNIIKNNKKEYQTLLDWIIKFGIAYNDETITPNIKQIAQEINTPYLAIAKYLKEIYFDILDQNLTNPRKFADNNEHLCCLFINYIGSYAFFNLGLKNIPRIGEIFTISFIAPKVGGDQFWVKRIRHEIINGKQRISIDLSSEEPNLYLHLLKEKAYLNKELHWSEYHGELEHETQERLIGRNKGL